jgi:hypothetical protein
MTFVSCASSLAVQSSGRSLRSLASREYSTPSRGTMEDGAHASSHARSGHAPLLCVWAVLITKGLVPAVLIEGVL